jgi:signal transduction histidine kinase
MAVDPAPAAGSAPPEPPGPGRAPVPRPRTDPVPWEEERWLSRLRVQRELHDGAALRISAVAARLGVVRHRVPEDQPELRRSIEDIQEDLHAALQELRSVARQIYPPLLELAGLGAALREAAGGTGVPVVVVAPPDRFSTAVEGAVYFAVTACLRALPPGGDEVRVTLRRDGDLLAVVLDGFPHRLAAMVLEEVRGLDGRVATHGRSASGTIEVGIPCA